LASEGDPIPVRYLFSLNFELQLGLVRGNGGGEFLRVAPQQSDPGLPERVIPFFPGSSFQYPPDLSSKR